MPAQTPTSQELQAPPHRASGIAADPARLTLGLALLGSLSVCYRGYHFYTVELHNSVGYSAIEAGTASAPEQYRIGVVRTAYWLSTHLHLQLSYSLGLLDLVGSTLAIILLYRVFRLSEVFRRAAPALRWIGSAAFVAMILFYLNWTLWYQKIATLPTTGIVAAMLWLWTPGPGSTPAARRNTPAWAAALGFLALVVMQALIRADVALFLCLGLFAISLTRARYRLALPATLARAVSLAGTVLAALIQLYLMKVLYPHAVYGNVPVTMILYDYAEPMLWFAFFIFLAPFLWTVYQAVQRRFDSDAAGLAFLLGGLGYVFFWIALGRLDEVRIFIPIGLALVPLLAELLILYAQDHLRE